MPVTQVIVRLPDRAAAERLASNVANSTCRSAAVAADQVGRSQYAGSWTNDPISSPCRAPRHRSPPVFRRIAARENYPRRRQSRGRRGSRSARPDRTCRRCDRTAADRACGPRDARRSDAGSSPQRVEEAQQGRIERVGRFLLYEMPRIGDRLDRHQPRHTRAHPRFPIVEETERRVLRAVHEQGRHPPIGIGPAQADLPVAIGGAISIESTDHAPHRIGVVVPRDERLELRLAQPAPGQRWRGWQRIEITAALGRHRLPPP